jgi:small subunit ribosomal protein S1
MRHAAREDNTTAKVDDTMDFKVIEFSKENKKIILSHSKIYLDVQGQGPEKTKQTDAAKNEVRSTKRVVKKIQDTLEKTTLGDIEALAALKSNLEETEKKEKPRKDKQAE